MSSTTTTTTSPSHPKISTFEEFVEVHGILLAASGIPPSLHRQLFHKLAGENFDGGTHFAVEPCEGGRQRRLVLTSDCLEKESSVFLVDHAWTFRLPDALKMLEGVPGLAERMASLMCVDGEEEEEFEEETEVVNKLSVAEVIEKEMEKVKGTRDAPVWLELEELGIDDDMLGAMDLSTKFPNLVALNLWGNRLCSAEIVIQELSKCRRLRAVWLNENPVANHPGGNIINAFIREIPVLEIFNSHFTEKYTSWALGFCGGVYGMENPGPLSSSTKKFEEINTLDISDRHIQQLKTEVLSPIALPFLSSLNIRGNPLEKTSVNDLLTLLKEFPCLKNLEVDIPGPLGNSASEILQHMPNLSSINGVTCTWILEHGKHVVDSALQPLLPKWSNNESLAHRIIGAMWLYLSTYRLADEEKIDETSVWYVMDELGSALRHCDEPNFRVAPFLYMPEGRLSTSISYSVLWPIHCVRQGDECFRDYLFGIGEDKLRSARLTAWFHTPENYFIQEFRKYCQQLLPPKTISHCTEHSTTKSILPSDGRSLRVYTDLPQVDEYLKRAEFVLS